MKIDNKKLLVLALLGGGALYLWKRRKPEVVTKEEPMGGGAGGAGGVFVPPTTITNIINTERPSGYFTKTPTKILESRKKDVKAGDTTLKDAAAAAKTAAGGLTADIRTGPNVTTPSSPTGPIGNASGKNILNIGVLKKHSKRKKA